LQGGVRVQERTGQGEGVMDRFLKSAQHLSVGNHRWFYLMVTLRKNLPVWSRMLRYRENPPWPDVLTSDL